jgi:biopolymer transport protein TolR
MRRRPSTILADINVVPYIDVMLVLLIIFMITTPLLNEGVKVNLPNAKAQTIQVKKEIPLIVTVDAKGLYYLNTNNDPNAALSPEALAVRVAAEIQLAKQNGASRQVLVRGDKSVDYGSVVAAMVLLQNAGVPEVGLMTEDPNSK